MEALGCLPPTLEPKATDHVPDMVATIEQIIANEHGYAVGGDVFFDVASLPGYGRLSGRAQVSCFLHDATGDMLYNVVLYCTVLYCTVLYCTVLYCTVLYCTVLYCTVLYCTVLYCTVLYCTVLHCTTLCAQVYQYVWKYITLKMYHAICPSCWSKQRTKCSEHSCDVRFDMFNVLGGNWDPTDKESAE